MDRNKFLIYAQLRWTNVNTLSHYLGLAKRLEAYWEGTELTQTTVNSFLASISRNQSYGNPLYTAFIKAYLECYKEDLDTAGRTIKVIRPTSHKLKLLNPKYLEVEDVNRLIKEMPDAQLKIIIRLFFETGLRCSELLAVKATDIDFGERTIKGIGKHNKEFKVKFSPKSLEWLVEWYEKCPYPDYPFKLLKKNGEPYANQPFALWDRMWRRARKIGFEKVTPHMLRHSLGYYLRKNLKLDLIQIKTKLRHESVATTQIYAPASQEEVDDLLDHKMFKVDDEEED